jgi:hypothetical protein
MSAADRLVSPWYPGLTCDHIYDDCPNYRRALPTLRRYGDDWVGGHPGVDPYDQDTCGMCAYRWKRKNPAGDPP